MMDCPRKMANVRYVRELVGRPELGTGDEDAPTGGDA
jgi:hypothetical protein